MRVEGVVALRSFVDTLEDLDLLKPILSPLLEGIFRLMNEVGRGRGHGQGLDYACLHRMLSQRWCQTRLNIIPYVLYADSSSCPLGMRPSASVCILKRDHCTALRAVQRPSMTLESVFS